MSTNPLDPPPLPRLCVDHESVIESARHLEHVGEGDVQRAAEARANQCPDCYRLNGRSLL